MSTRPNRDDPHQPAPDSHDQAEVQARQNVLDLFIVAYGGRWAERLGPAREAVDALIAACLRRSGAQRRDEQHDDQGASAPARTPASFADAGTEALPIVVDDPSGGPSVVFRSVDELKAELQRMCLVNAHHQGRAEAAEKVARDTLWMAGRYADGRRSYAVGLYNDALAIAQRGGYAEGAKPARDGMFDQVGRVPVVEEEKKEDNAALAAGETGPCLEAPREAWSERMTGYVRRRHKDAKAAYLRVWAASENKAESDYDEGRMDALGDALAQFEANESRVGCVSVANERSESSPLTPERSEIKNSLPALPRPLGAILSCPICTVWTGYPLEVIDHIRAQHAPK